MRIDLPAIDARLAAPCPRPVPIEGEAVTSAEVQRSWARDRSALLTCRAQKAAIVKGYEELRGRIGGTR